MSTRGFVGYQHKGIIKGWYNHSDSYESQLGESIIEKYSSLTQTQLQEFFLGKLSLVVRTENPAKADEDEKAYCNHHGIMDKDWSALEKHTLQDGGEFYKDGLSCEYSYIFNLDSSTKRLLLFKGFGKKPSKGYETWYYKSRRPYDPNDKDSQELYYMRYMGNIKGDILLLSARVQMYLLFGKKDKEDETVKLLKKIKEWSKRCPTDLPLLLAEVDACDGIVKDYYEYKLKGGV